MPFKIAIVHLAEALTASTIAPIAISVYVVAVEVTVALTDETMEVREAEMVFMMAILTVGNWFEDVFGLEDYSSEAIAIIVIGDSSTSKIKVAVVAADCWGRMDLS